MEFFTELTYKGENRHTLYSQKRKGHTMEEQTIVDVRGISKTIQGETIIHDLSFSVRRGEIYGLLGRMVQAKHVRFVSW